MATPKPGGTFKLSLSGSKNKDALKAKLPSASAAPAKKRRLLLGDDDEEDDTSSHQAISGWDTSTGGAIDISGPKKEHKGPRVIEALPNRNWRADALKKKQNGQQKEEVVFEEPEVKFGLQVFDKKTATDGEGDQVMQDVGKEEEAKKEVDDGLTEEERLDKKAREALQNGKLEDQSVIPHITEEEAFENDVREAPDAPSLDAYEATPIEGFGAALLRGMGWKDGEEIGKNKGVAAKPKEVKRRPALLGIGAKPEAAVGTEIGAWGGGKGKKRKEEQTYTPVVLRNKNTGELVTEEELKKKLEAQQLVDEDEKKSGSKKSRYDDEDDRGKRRIKYDDSEDERDRRKRKSKYDDYSDDERRRERRHKEKRDRDRRDRSEDRDDRRRDRRRDDYDDKRKEKRRDYSDDERRREKRRDRDYSDDERRREKRRERRDRSRSPDRDRDSERKRRRDYEYEDDRDDRKRRHRYEEDRKYRK